jgi:hypothetical protein
MLRLALCLLVLLQVGCKQMLDQFQNQNQNQLMEEFTSTEWKFKAKFPGKPKQGEQTVMGVKVQMFSVEQKEGVYGVGVSDMPMPAGVTAGNKEGMLDGARDGSIRNVNGKLKWSAPTFLAGNYQWPGREFAAMITQPTQGQIRSRIYLVGKRLYQVVVVGTDGYATSAQSTEFLDSFQLMN